MADSAASMLRIHALTKRYGNFVAVDSVNLAVEAGEIVGLLGPNGAGKTTILECLLGLRTPDRGDLTIAGASTASDTRRMRQLVGAQIQPAALQDKITVHEALVFFGAFHPAPAAPHELLARFGLAHRARARFDTLSLGERQRLAVALAFVGRPQVLVLDEPTTGMDPLGRRELHRILAAFRDEGGTVLLSTHDLAEAEALCNRVALLHRGRIVADAPPAALVERADAATAITFRCARPLGALPDPLQALLDARSFTAGPPQTLLLSRQPARAVALLAQHMAATDNELLELTLRPPSLEDAFAALTGERWEDSP